MLSPEYLHEKVICLLQTLQIDVDLEDQGMVSYQYPHPSHQLMVLRQTVRLVYLKAEIYRYEYDARCDREDLGLNPPGVNQEVHLPTHSGVGYRL